MQFEQFLGAFHDLRQIVLSDLQETADDDRSTQNFAETIQQREETVREGSAKSVFLICGLFSFPCLDHTGPACT